MMQVNSALYAAVQTTNTKAAKKAGEYHIPMPGSQQAEEAVLAEFSEEVQEESAAEGTSFADPIGKMTEEQKGYLALMEECQKRIESAKKAFDKLNPEPTPVPSALGLGKGAAAEKLKRAGLGVSGVSQEYHDDVPKGQVITQIPGPGSRISKGSGIRLIVSKGPPPGKEKRDLIRHREELPGEKSAGDADSAQKAAEIPTLTTQGLVEAFVAASQSVATE